MDNTFDILKKEKDGTMVWIAAVGQLHTAAALVAEFSLKNIPANTTSSTSVRER